MYQLLVFVAMLSAAMLVGLMATLLFVNRSMWRAQSDERAGASFHDFLNVAATSPLLRTLALLPVICTVAIAFVGAPQSTKYGYALIGGAVFLIGFNVWTAFVNMPVYRIMTRWDGQSPGEVRPLLRRFHQANVVRLGSALAAVVLFFLAA